MNRLVASQLMKNARRAFSVSSPILETSRSVTKMVDLRKIMKDLESKRFVKIDIDKTEKCMFLVHDPDSNEKTLNRIMFNMNDPKLVIDYVEKSDNYCIRIYFKEDLDKIERSEKSGLYIDIGIYALATMVGTYILMNAMH